MYALDAQLLVNAYATHTHTFTIQSFLIQIEAEKPYTEATWWKHPVLTIIQIPVSFSKAKKRGKRPKERKDLSYMVFWHLWSSYLRRCLCVGNSARAQAFASRCYSRSRRRRRRGSGAKGGACALRLRGLWFRRVPAGGEWGVERARAGLTAPTAHEEALGPEGGGGGGRQPRSGQAE